MYLVGLAVAALVGVVASFIAWWISYRALTPNIGWSTGICRSVGDPGACRVKFGNLGRRDVVDVKVACTMRIRNLDRLPREDPQASNYATVDIPLMGGSVDLLQRRKPRDLPAHLPGASDRSAISRNRIARLLTNEISEFQLARLPKTLRDSQERRTLSLDDLFELGDDAYVDFTIYCYDGYSGARRVLRSPKKYRQSDVVTGRFRKQGFEIVAASTPA